MSMRINPRNIKGSLSAQYNFKNYNTLYHNRKPTGFPPTGESTQRKQTIRKEYGFKSIRNAYLRDIDETIGDYNTLIFDYVPEQINDEVAANYTATNIIGRSAPLQGYQDSGPRTFNIELKFHASLDKAQEEEFYDAKGFQAVKAKIDWLRSLAYPDYSSQYAKPPHRVLLVIGELIKSICVVENVNVTYKAPWDDNLLPMVAELTLPLKEVNPVPWGLYDVRYGMDTASG